MTLTELQRQRAAIIRNIEANPKKGANWALGQLARAEQLAQKIREIKRGKL